ncbi:NADP(H)-dependent aldo-keto reductase [Ectothiorhodospira variabilis]|uniref:NADP(H)-dependent aldo-keto reductase n=1 Tax=Ectothiorhodospira variabilis TaxID=505694 RepID=UPI001EFBE8B1|nr:NADP(H)-dependent aldo-keto reductase [Ectothiorhodospira variabilis]MCG5494286.1 NADP(H)-dependent aldo-keto reductase [Ectothiorhodospira variabilis]MCG5504053.1 NADP(H)-dependent aldo-keto reductase [Ectothiorhodospira variabilis]MCG5507208.1 NADP(H)-dependent aldo-keto reductase [Ectothiorhodospira variabilis]
MQTKPLGRSGIQVSTLCLGTMTWGEQNTEAEAHSQLDMAMERGINFIDTAEMYPVPPKAETQGLTEQYLGTWLARRGRRDDLVIASKASGPSENFSHIRSGPQLDRPHLEQALHDSLQRLQTDYLDLYQVHWPSRPTNYFGQLGYRHQDDAGATPIAETLEVLADFVRAGKVRTIGISNETPWGLMEYLRLAEQADLPRVVSIQNPYNLLNRSFEVGLAEMAIRENVGLLAYSPMAFGALSGKYLDDAPPDGRITLYSRFVRYSGETGVAATREYADIARRHGLSPAQMSLAFVNAQPFLTSNIIGATKLSQLEENLDSLEVSLSEAVLEEIEAVHERYPVPCP